jgi:hypothetical protein
MRVSARGRGVSLSGADRRRIAAGHSCLRPPPQRQGRQPAATCPPSGVQLRGERPLADAASGGPSAAVLRKVPLLTGARSGSVPSALGRRHDHAGGLRIRQKACLVDFSQRRSWCFRFRAIIAKLSSKGKQNSQLRVEGERISRTGLGGHREWTGDGRATHDNFA